MNKLLRFRQYIINGGTHGGFTGFHHFGYVKNQGYVSWISPIDHNIDGEQFTGMKDMNGKEICEGDIVEGDWINRDYEEHLVCAVTVGGGCVYPFTEGVGDSSGFLYSTEISTKHFKIIGNIHENPELIGGTS